MIVDMPCERCGNPIKSDTDRHTIQNALCSRCRKQWKEFFEENKHLNKPCYQKNYTWEAFIRTSIEPDLEKVS